MVSLVHGDGTWRAGSHPLALVSPDAAAATARATAMLDAVGLGNRGGDYARDLSGG